MYVFFFFFQAEDGIRDTSVTGVQTCALPILAGDLVRTLHKTDPTTSVLPWDLLTERQLPVGSGVYIYHVEAPGIGDVVGRVRSEERRVGKECRGGWAGCVERRKRGTIEKIER